MKSQLSYVYHILDEIKFIESQINNKNLDKALFLEDDMAKRAFARSVEVIGEAVKISQWKYMKSILIFPGEK